MLYDGTARVDRERFEQCTASAAGLDALRSGSVVALMVDNGIDWLVSAAAVGRSGAVLLPLPAFFTDAQCLHAIEATGATLLLTDDSWRGSRLGFSRGGSLSGTRLDAMQRTAPEACAGMRAAMPAGTGLVTFTSGTTGAPRGVCLGLDALDRVSRGVATVASRLGIERHLCLLPLAVLLEQVAGAGAAALAGATTVALPLAEVGLDGSSGFDPVRALAAIRKHDVHSVILLPQMLQALVDAVAAGACAPASLRLAAVGGGRVPPALIERARSLGIPACEGYGLSECGSVVALALPQDAPDAGMRLLPHARARIVAPAVRVEGATAGAPVMATAVVDAGACDAADEILVEGPAFLGYLGAAPQVPHAPVRTGDLGSIDAHGRLRVTGRLKHLLITGFGRNVSPEWPESELLARAPIRQAAVFGEGRPWLSAVLVVQAGATEAAIALAVAEANARLPDYARIGGWVVANAAFTQADGLLTANGRLRRDTILARHASAIDAIHERPPMEMVDALP
jgi:long-subunit acyl-CoA synthetase (AMP-forming)